MHVCHKVFHAHLLHGDFIPEQIHGMDAYGQLSDISQRILLLIFHTKSAESYGIEETETNAIERDFGSDDWFKLFQGYVCSPLLHSGYAKYHEKYQI